MKKMMAIFVVCLLVFISCKAFRFSTDGTTIEVETAHIAYLSIICADDTICGV